MNLLSIYWEWENKSITHLLRIQHLACSPNWKSLGRSSTKHSRQKIRNAIAMWFSRHKVINLFYFRCGITWPNNFPSDKGNPRG